MIGEEEIESVMGFAKVLVVNGQFDPWFALGELKPIKNPPKGGGFYPAIGWIYPIRGAFSATRVDSVEARSSGKL